MDFNPMRLSQYKQAIAFVPVSLVKRATDYARKTLKQLKPLVYDAELRDHGKWLVMLQDSKGTKTNLLLDPRRDQIVVAALTSEPLKRALARIEALEQRGQDAVAGTLRRLKATSDPGKLMGIYYAAQTKGKRDKRWLALAKQAAAKYRATVGQPVPKLHAAAARRVTPVTKFLKLTPSERKKISNKDAASVIEDALTQLAQLQEAMAPLREALDFLEEHKLNGLFTQYEANVIELRNVIAAQITRPSSKYKTVLDTLKERKPKLIALVDELIEENTSTKTYVRLALRDAVPSSFPKAKGKPVKVKATTVLGRLAAQRQAGSWAGLRNMWQRAGDLARGLWAKVKQKLVPRYQRLLTQQNNAVKQLISELKRQGA